MNPPDPLIGKRVAFKDDAEHYECWHFQSGLKGGVVLRKALTLAQKAQMVSAEIEIDPETFAGDNEVPRYWVKADPCDRFPNGCEVAVEPDCLTVVSR
jgi:hypothetical protein